ncbi:ABC/ECF transporter, transmembrane component [Syntrophomonas zehnderi OL-4]|uniref:ABC/ECF transporter, transmembrane component n=1 Tax=Syntrophomonas zehnderi OL-4 TaxID=690567 RepID=A0A0E4C947_9FIRM|nr:energy-coupling factor transporter transmembrane component T [Syntrophomonas zehnderi]CFX85338.1 ABC/ECF transporter, transmembrane component [Syntrophomonas zehnderi OL-4]
MYNLGQYIPRQSPVHNRDPRVKLIGVVVLGIIILQMNITGLLAVTALFLVISLIARIPVSSLLNSLRPVLPFFFFLFLVYVFFTPGHPLPWFSFGPVKISYEGLQLGIIQISKFLLLVVAASLLTMTTTPSEITMGLERLLRPLRFIGISSYNVALLVSLALRFIPMLLDEMNSIKEAQLARGANVNQRRISGKIKSITNLAVPLSINILRRCDDLVDAMESRGYHPGPRTYLYELALTRTDYGLIATLTGLLIVFLIYHP